MSFHTYNADFDFDFYLEQNKIMEERYSLLFKNRKLSWNNYFNEAKRKLENNVYFIWIFLCGLETFLKSNNYLNFENNKILNKMLYKDAQERIYRIIGDSKKNEDYINSL